MNRRSPPDLSRTVIAIPARDEAAHLPACLEGLARQQGSQFSDILVLVNNSSDETARIARHFPCEVGTTLHVVERTLPKHRANAGHARRLAMSLAAPLAGRDGILFTTDADSVADPEWLGENLAAIAAGADAVAGWVELDPRDWSRIPLSLHEDDARECAYDAVCDEIVALLDPDAADPWPRHTQNSGASIAVTAAAFRAAGGIPAVASAEDRAFFAALRRSGARIRHAPECRVVVSGRTEGRAVGGMAETIKRRLTAPDEFLDPRLEPADDCARRARLRRRLRHCFGDKNLMAPFLSDVGLAATPRSARRFDALWDAIEAASPILQRTPVRVTDLPAQMARAEVLRAGLRAQTRRARPTAAGTSTPLFSTGVEPDALVNSECAVASAMTGEPSSPKQAG
jgi:GT2 family glycosyltransferase